MPKFLKIANWILNVFVVLLVVLFTAEVTRILILGEITIWGALLCYAIIAGIVYAFHKVILRKW